MASVIQRAQPRFSGLHTRNKSNPDFGMRFCLGFDDPAAAKACSMNFFWDKMRRAGADAPAGRCLIGSAVCYMTLPERAKNSKIAAPKIAVMEPAFNLPNFN